MGKPLRIVIWNHTGRTVTIRHTREVGPEDETVLHAAMQAYVAVLARAHISPNPER